MEIRKRSKLKDFELVRKKDGERDKDGKMVQFGRTSAEDVFPNLSEVIPPPIISDLHPAWKLRK